jgi:cytosine deaminase
VAVFPAKTLRKAGKEGVEDILVPTGKGLIVTQVRLEGRPGLFALEIESGQFASIHRMEDVSAPDDGSSTIFDAKGMLALPGLIETHIHLDKACIADRCHIEHGTLAEALSETVKAKAGFTESDVYQRGAKVIESAIAMGTTHMRTHVEVDPVVGLRSFEAVRQLQLDYQWAISLEICVYPQDGLHNNPGTVELLEQALAAGSDLLGGCPYTDSDPEAQIRSLFDMAKRYDVDLDFHLDFDLDPNNMRLPTVIECTMQYGYEGRVTVGHVTKLSSVEPERLAKIASQMAAAGVHLTALPSTDLYLMGRGVSNNVPRGVAPLMKLKDAGVVCSISSNNIRNPYTPFGDASLVRQANLYANVGHLGTPTALATCLDWISAESARILRLKKYGISELFWADFGLYQASSKAEVIATLCQPSFGFKAGRLTFERPQVQLMKP